MNVHHPKLKKTLLLSATFFAGANCMIIELAGARLLSTWFGNSLFTWTGLIGIFLISISVGNYLGGYLSDKYKTGALLGHIHFIAAPLTMIIPWLQRSLDSFFSTSHVISGPIVASFILFSMPGILIGTISPFVIRMVSLINKDTHIGNSAGIVGMLSTIGSVLGTFASGFLLIPHFKIQTIYFMSGTIFIILALSFYYFDFSSQKKGLTHPLVGGSLLQIFLVLFIYFTPAKPIQDPSIVHEENTFYHRIRVYKNPANNGDFIKELSLDTTFEGAQFEYSPKIPFRYQEFAMNIIENIFDKNQPIQGAFLGGGAFTMPLNFVNNYPQGISKVIEIDPRVIEVGKKFFKVESNPRLKTYVDDARRFLQFNQNQMQKDQNTKTHLSFDFIFGDTYNGIRCIPAHFVTKEYFKLIKNNLKSEGIFLINIISSINGEKSQLFEGIYNTLESVFGNIYVFATNLSALNNMQNILILASDKNIALKEDSFVMTELFVSPLKYQLRKKITFTDMFNPVEYIVAKGLLEN